MVLASKTECRVFAALFAACCRKIVVTLSAMNASSLSDRLKGATVKHDSQKLRLIRERLGMTQEKLSILSRVSERTVQRAESGAQVSLETLNDFAAALEVPLSELVENLADATADNHAALRRVNVARTLLDDLTRAGVADFDCEIDPSTSEMETLLALVGLIESRLPNWDHTASPSYLSLRERIEMASTISSQINALHESGISLYSSASWIMARVPRYDMDEGFYSTHTRQPFERVMTLQLLISRSTDEKIYRKAPGSWGLEEQPPPPPSWGDLSDDVPF